MFLRLTCLFVFYRNSGGLATLSAFCNNLKHRGTTGIANPVGDAFAVYVILFIFCLL